MLKLYKWVEDTLYYAECWTGGGEATVHTGIVGDEGTSEAVPDVDEAVYINDFRQKYIAQGYNEWRQEEFYWVILQWPMKTLTGSSYNRAIRDDATIILNELLGWRGLGHVDGFDMGKTMNPKREEFALNIFCLVVDADIAVKCILDVLPEKLDCARLKIGVRLNDEDSSCKLYYSAKEKETWFYL